MKHALIIVRKPLAQIAYEEDVRRKPVYHDGSKRPAWDNLGDHAKRSWEENPTPRTYRRSYPHSVCREVDEMAAILNNAFGWGIIIAFLAILWSL